MNLTRYRLLIFVVLFSQLLSAWATDAFNKSQVQSTLSELFQEHNALTGHEFEARIDSWDESDRREALEKVHSHPNPQAKVVLFVVDPDSGKLEIHESLAIAPILSAEKKNEIISRFDKIKSTGLGNAVAAGVSELMRLVESPAVLDAEFNTKIRTIGQPDLEATNPLAASLIQLAAFAGVLISLFFALHVSNRETHYSSEGVAKFNPVWQPIKEMLFELKRKTQGNRRVRVGVGGTFGDW